MGQVLAEPIWKTDPTGRAREGWNFVRRREKAVQRFVAIKRADSKINTGPSTRVTVKCTSTRSALLGKSEGCDERNLLARENPLEKALPPPRSGGGKLSTENSRFTAMP
ncbi:hypothetical protein ZHAS_00021186 [Anopheles sinensis]|uniref:Uncharacterized protein n=1 Tax=Anopheles sinensis TaxID=74873 RepID=A0A084WRR3_ANOSI|nr:hypothetical protein ZHAS_00021186 [Anopheles sinensis]